MRFSTAMRSISHVALRSCLILAASRAVAQVVGGQVVDPAARPLAHVGLRLVDSLNVAVDSTVADSSGTFYLTAPRPGLYRVRLDVPGLVPVVSAPIRLSRDAFEQRLIALTVVPNVRVYIDEPLQRPVRPFASNRPPLYPAALNFRDREGDVLLQFVVDSAGYPIRGTARVLRSTDSLFAASALRALGTYRFYPAEADGHPVASLVVLPFEFHMPSERCWRGPDSLTGRQPNERCN